MNAPRLTLRPKAAPSIAGGDPARLRRLRVVPWLALLAVIVLAVAWPYMVSSFYVNLATLALFYGLFALSINLIAGYGGMITIGQAGLLGGGAYGVAIFTTHYGLSLGVAIVAALGVTLLLSAFFGILAVRTRGTYFVMVTLAEGMIVYGIAYRWPLTGGDNGITGIPKPAFAEEYWQYYYLVLVVVAVCTFLIARLVRSPFGLSLKAIRESEDRLPPMGYNVTLHKVIAFTISGLFAGVAGVLLAMYNNFVGPSNVYFLASAQGLLMSILGGVGTLTGAFVGSAVVIFIQNDVSSYITRWQTLLGVIFVLIVLLAPDGLVGTWTRVVWSAIVRRVTGGGKRPAGPVGVEAGAEAVRARRPARAAIETGGEVTTDVQRR